METSMAENRIKALVVGVAVLTPALANASEIRGELADLFGTGPAKSDNRESISKENCISSKYSRGSGHVASNQCWRSCEALLPTNTKWPELVRQYGKGQGDAFSLWKPAVESFINWRIEQKDQNVKSSQTGTEFENLIGLIHRCHALITVSDHSDYSNDDLHTLGSRNEYHIRKSLINPELKCRSMGTDTQDYSSCDSLLTLYDTFTFAKKAKETVDMVRYDDHVADKHDELVQKRLKGDTVGVSDSLNVQKESLKKQKDIATENMVISAAQMASLVAIVESMPTLKSLLKDQCLPRMQDKEKMFKKLYEWGKQRAIDTPENNWSVERDEPEEKNTWAWPAEPSPLLEVDPLCADISSMKISLILNTDVRDMGWALITQSGIEAVANLAKGAILKKRIKGIDGAIKDIDEFTPESLTEEEMEEIYMRECAVNPELPKCKIRTPRRVAGINNSYSFGAGNGNPTLGGSGETPEANQSAGNPDVDRSNLPQGVGTPPSRHQHPGEKRFLRRHPLRRLLCLRQRGRQPPWWGERWRSRECGPPLIRQQRRWRWEQPHCRQNHRPQGQLRRQWLRLEGIQLRGKKYREKTSNFVGQPFRQALRKRQEKGRQRVDGVSQSRLKKTHPGGKHL